MFLTPLYWQALLLGLSRVYVFKAEFRAILRVPQLVVEAKIVVSLAVRCGIRDKRVGLKKETA
jgi:hypothetical protein